MKRSRVAEDFRINKLIEVTNKYTLTLEEAAGICLCVSATQNLEGMDSNSDSLKIVCIL